MIPIRFWIDYLDFEGEEMIHSIEMICSMHINIDQLLINYIIYIIFD
jgi:hypothetical protein